MGVGLNYQRYVIANLMNCVQNRVSRPDSNPQCYSYNLYADADGTTNYLDLSFLLRPFFGRLGFDSGLVCFA